VGGPLIAEEDYFGGETDPLDLGMEHFIDLEDHDFVGRSTVSQRMAEHPRRFVMIALERGTAPAHDDPVLLHDEVVGRVTSADVSPRFGVLALAVVDAARSAPGSRLEIDDPQKLRPRSDPRHPLTADPVPMRASVAMTLEGSPLGGTDTRGALQAIDRVGRR